MRPLFHPPHDNKHGQLQQKLSFKKFEDSIAIVHNNLASQRLTKEFTYTARCRNRPEDKKTWFAARQTLTTGTIFYFEKFDVMLVNYLSQILSQKEKKHDVVIQKQSNLLKQQK